MKSINLLAALLPALLLVCGSCKSRPSANTLKEAKTQPASGCDLQSIQDQIKELDSTESQVVYAQHLKFSIETSGACTLPKTECQDNCGATFGGLMGVLYSKSHEQCLDQCQSAFNSCQKRNQEAIAKGQKESVDTNQLLADREELLARREQILKSLHLCSTNADEAKKLTQQLQAGLSQQQEWILLGKVIDNLTDIDGAAQVTFRFVSGTAIDTPARISSQSRDEWAAAMKSNKYWEHLGLMTLDVIVAAERHTSKTFDRLVGIERNATNTEKTLEDLGAGTQHVLNIVKSCANVTDTCTAISCLGHRTQEILSVADNVQRLEVPAFTTDGRKFALCRHYAPTYTDACNLWAKEHGLENQMQCEAEVQYTQMHAYPIISLTSNGKTSKYIYDILNDPMTPDLMPINSEASQSVSVPCLSVAK